MDGVTETDNVFGAWLMTDRCTDHYFLNGKTLCGVPAVTAGQKRWKIYGKHGSHPIVGFRCPECHRLNIERWRKM